MRTRNILIVVLVVLLVLSIAAACFAWWGRGGEVAFRPSALRAWGHMPAWGLRQAAHPMMLPFGLLALAAGIGLIWLVASLFGRKPAPPQADTPLEILKRRYARGEVTREEYEEMKRELT